MIATCNSPLENFDVINILVIKYDLNLMQQPQA